MDNESKLDKITREISRGETIKSESIRINSITEFLRLSKTASQDDNVYLCYNEAKRKFWVSVVFSKDYLKASGNHVIEFN